MAYSPQCSVAAVAAAAACRHHATGRASSTAHAAAALLLKQQRVSLASSSAAAASHRRRALQRMPCSRLSCPAAALPKGNSSRGPGLAAAAAVNVAAATATATMWQGLQQRHHGLWSASAAAAASSSSAFSRAGQSVLRCSAAALLQQPALCCLSTGAAAAVAAPSHAHPCTLSSASSSRCLSSTSSSSSTATGDPAGPPSAAARGSKKTTASQGGGEEQQQEGEEPSGGASPATAAARQAGPNRAATATAAPTGGEDETAAAAGRDSKPHKRPTHASDSQQEGAADTPPAPEDAYAALQEKYRACLQEVEMLRRKTETLQDKALRALAEMENARTRHQKELARTREYAASDFAKAMLEVADSMAYATKALRATLPHEQQQQQHMGGPTTAAAGTSSSSSTSLTVEQLQHIYEGIAMTESLLHRTLDRFGVQQFDPPLLLSSLEPNTRPHRGRHPTAAENRNPIIERLLHTQLYETGEVFDPAVHEALFEIDDPTKEKGRVAQVIQMGYKIKDRVLRAAKVGVARGGSGSTKAS